MIDRRIVWVAAIVAALGAFAGRAADVPVAMPTPEPPAPEAITQWTQDALQRLIDLRSEVGITSQDEREIAKFDALRERYEKGYAAFRRDPSRLDQLSETALQDARVELESVSAAATEAERSFSETAARLEARLHEIADLRSRARTLRSDATAPALPRPLRTRLDAIVAESAPLQRTVERSFDKVTTAQNNVLELKEAVEGLRTVAAEASASRLRRLFRFEQPPFWKVAPDNVASAARHSGVLVGSAVPEALLKFVADHGGELVLHAMLLALMVYVVFRLRRSAPAGEQGERASKVLERPLSTSLLVGLLITPVLHPEAPFVARELSVALLIVPMLRILTLYFDRSAWPQLFALVGLFLVERVLSALSIEVLLQRLVLLALSGAMIALLWWMRVSRIESRLDLKPELQRWVIGLTWVALFASIASIVLNVLGNSNLSLVIESAVVRSMVLASALRASVIVLREVGRLMVQALERRGVRSVTRNRAAVLRRLDIVTMVLSSTLWVYYTLSMLRLDEIVVGAIAGAIASEFKIGGVTLSLSRLIAFVVAVWLAVRISGVTRAALNDDVLPRFPLPRGVPNAISVMANYAIVLIGLLIGAAILGVSLTSITLIMGALGVGIGFGLQNIVNNFVSGLILVFERPVQVGDAVQFGDLTGVVSQIGFRASRIRTYSGAEVIVPNGDLISQQLVNWTLSDRRRRLELPIAVAYGSNCELVERVLNAVVTADPEVMKDPPPLVVLDGFGATSLEFRAYCWIPDYDIGLKVRNRLNRGMIAALLEAGVEIPSTRREFLLVPPPSSDRDERAGPAS